MISEILFKLKNFWSSYGKIIIILV